MTRVYRQSKWLWVVILSVELWIGFVSTQIGSWGWIAGAVAGSVSVCAFMWWTSRNRRLETNGRLKYYDWNGVLRLDAGWEDVRKLAPDGGGYGGYVLLTTNEGNVYLSFLEDLGQLANTIRELCPQAKVSSYLGDPFHVNPPR